MAETERLAMNLWREASREDMECGVAIIANMAIQNLVYVLRLELVAV